MKRGPWLLLLLAALLNLQCGYRLAGRGRNVPAEARTIAIPALLNDTASFAAQQFITAAIREEFPKRSRLRLCDSVEKADLLLEGRISAFETVPVTARRGEVRLSVKVRLIDMKKNVLVYEGIGLAFRETYEAAAGGKIPVGDDFFFLAADAREKIAAKFAAAIVSAILDNF